MIRQWTNINDKLEILKLIKEDKKKWKMDNSSNKINVREHRRAIQRNYQHWEHKAHAETNKQTNKKPIHTTLENTDGQYRETISIGNTRHMLSQVHYFSCDRYLLRWDINLQLYHTIAATTSPFYISLVTG